MRDESTAKYSLETTAAAVYAGLIILFGICWSPLKLLSLLPECSDINATSLATCGLFLIAITMRIRGVIPCKKNGVFSQKKRFKPLTTAIHISARKELSEPVEMKEINDIMDDIVDEVLTQKNKGIKTVIIESHILGSEILRNRLRKKIQKALPEINITLVSEKTSWYPFIAIPLFYRLIHCKEVRVYKKSGKLTVHF